MSNDSTTTIVSAPGKVLIAGGYLVLDPAYSGLVVSTSSRFYTVINVAPNHEPLSITVSSPQFNDATWTYVVQLHAHGQVQVESSPKNRSKNKFVHLALQKTISLAAELNGHDDLRKAVSETLAIAIVGDNDFYSQRAQLAEQNLPRNMSSLGQIQPFVSTGVQLSDVHKTGLGSSAALITSLVSALLVRLNVISSQSLSQPNSEGQRLAHNLSQYVHCLAQGKVGSGFDVSAAVFGSHLYKRFNPKVIEGAMSDDPSQSLHSIVSPANTSWNYQIGEFKLPPLTRIMLADVDAGSDTPSLVGKVLQWRKQNSEEAHSLWTTLDQLNQSLAHTLAQTAKLHDMDSVSYVKVVNYLSSLQSIQWTADPSLPENESSIISVFYEAHKISQAIRTKMKEMGELSGVPIEPSEQTQLLDVCTNLAGVIGGGVPGAGGYDAIWLLVLEPDGAMLEDRPADRVDRTWSKYKDLDVSPLSAKESVSSGVRIESFDAIKGLRAAVGVGEALS